MTLSQRNKYLIWAAVWILGAGLMVTQVGYWSHTGLNIEDVTNYNQWSDYLVTQHALPIETTWQYPPGAAFLMLVPRIGGGDFGQSFVVTMLVFYLVGLVLMIWLARREERDVGVWIWLLAIPVLGRYPVLRFDLVPTVIAMAALVVIHRRPAWFGALAGLGAMVKVWPIVLLFGEWKRRRLLVSVAAAGVVIVLMFLLSAILYGDQTGFLSNQDSRGLQVEAVAATPWQVWQTISSVMPNLVSRSGALEIDSGLAEAVAAVFTYLELAVLVAAAAWWFLRDRAIRAGRSDLTTAAVSRDFIFAVVLALVVISRVLSPQYMIWLVALAAIVLSDRETRLARPAWIVIGAAILTAGIYQSPANFIFRNLALVVAMIDAGWTVFALVRRRE